MCVFPSHDIRFYKGDKKCLVLAWWQCNLFYSFDGLSPTVMSLIGWKISLTQEGPCTLSTKVKQCVCAEPHMNQLHQQRWRPHNSGGNEKGQLCGSLLDFSEQWPPQCLLVNTQTHTHTQSTRLAQQWWHCKKILCTCRHLCMYVHVNKHTLSH